MPCLVGDASGSFQKFDTLDPFGMCQIDVAGKAVQMRCKALHDLAQTWVCILTKIIHEDFGDIILGDVTHAGLR